MTVKEYIEPKLSRLNEEEKRQFFALWKKCEYSRLHNLSCCFQENDFYIKEMLDSYYEATINEWKKSKK